MLTVALVQIARRVRSTDHIAKASEKGSKKRAVRYQCACLDEDVYLHPQSSLYTAAPEFVVYTQLIRSTKRPYMTGQIPNFDSLALRSFCNFGSYKLIGSYGRIAAFGLT